MDLIHDWSGGGSPFVAGNQGIQKCAPQAPKILTSNADIIADIRKEFESYIGTNVEQQLTLNQRVTGSSPVQGTF